MLNSISKSQSINPLDVDEVIRFLRKRWGVSYELRLVVKGKKIYLQIMWGFLEQQSFDITEKDYCENLSKVLEVINRIGMSGEVRAWLLQVKGKPRLGRALSLPLKGDDSLEEFVI